MKEKTRIPTSSEPIPWASPFVALKNVGLPLAPAVQPSASSRDAPSIASKKNRGRVDIIRQTAHRGGKTVTVVTGFIGIWAGRTRDTRQGDAETLWRRRHGEGGTDRNSRRPARGSRPHPDQVRFSAGMCWRVIGLQGLPP